VASSVASGVKVLRVFLVSRSISLTCVGGLASTTGTGIATAVGVGTTAGEIMGTARAPAAKAINRVSRFWLSRSAFCCTHDTAGNAQNQLCSISAWHSGKCCNNAGHITKLALCTGTSSRNMEAQKWMQGASITHFVSNHVQVNSANSKSLPSASRQSSCRPCNRAAAESVLSAKKGEQKDR